MRLACRRDAKGLTKAVTCHDCAGLSQRAGA
jgi:hypothetical protein